MKLLKHILLLCLILLLGPLDTAKAELGLSFQARVTIDLCPEYKFGGVELDVKYTVGADPKLIDANVLSKTINTEDQTATVDLEFPSYYGVLPFNVQAFCRSTHGESNASNIISVSNCDHLARYDTDADGIPNNMEDTNCDNFFSPGDVSNPDNVDTDGDGVRDLVEGLQGFDLTNPGSSPRPYIFSSSVFDPDNNGSANPVVWRETNATWYIRDFITPGNHIAFPFGRTGDIPFAYSPENAPEEVGIIRSINNNYIWIFRGPGFLHKDGSQETELTFGLFGDNIVLGPWEKPGITNPAVARLYNGQWSFYIYLSNGSIRIQNWGGNGDIPKVQDHDGDGLFDIAVFRPSEQKTYIIRSSDQKVEIYNFGTGTADHTVRGDYTGDGIDDVAFWEPISGMFSVMTSDNGFDDEAAKSKDPDHYLELQLGLYNIHLPLNWNYQNGHLLFTVIDHATGLRYWRKDNSPNNPPQSLQWGLPGDHQG